jgi:ADP-heptose:LPS heptosyltransferase
VGPGDVLALRALGLGDALTGIPALRGLRRLFPDQRLVLAAPPSVGGWLVSLGVVDANLPLPGLVPVPGAVGGHVAVDLHGRGPASQRLLASTRPRRLLAFDCADVGHDGPRWLEDEHEVDRWCRLVRNAGGRCGREDLRLRNRPSGDGAARVPAGDLPVLLHPGAASAARRWPADRWRLVAAALAGRGHRIVVTGSSTEADLGAMVANGLTGVEDHTGRYDLAGLSDLVAGAGLVLSTDTGMAHLATAWCVPSLVLFGPVPPARWGPAIDHDLHTVLWHGDPEAGHWGDPHGDRLDERLADVTVPEVLAASGELLRITYR